jgi:hypothetical protein
VNTIASSAYRLAEHLADLFSCNMGHSPYQVQNSTEFVHVFGSLQVDTRDIMVSFDVVSLFTKVPIQEIVDLLGRHFEEGILQTFRHVLTTSYFTFNGQFYEQTDGVAMSSPLPPVIDNFYMKYYERAELESPPPKKKPTAGFAM